MKNSAVGGIDFLEDESVQNVQQMFQLKYCYFDINIVAKHSCRKIILDELQLDVMC